jgi:hypothetical protein
MLPECEVAKDYVQRLVVVLTDSTTSELVGWLVWY